MKGLKYYKEIHEQLTEWHPRLTAELMATGQMQHHLAEVGGQIADRVAQGLARGLQGHEAEHEALAELVYGPPEEIPDPTP